jgi:hypothetical protein
VRTELIRSSFSGWKAEEEFVEPEGDRRSRRISGREQVKWEGN